MSKFCFIQPKLRLHLLVSSSFAIKAPATMSSRHQDWDPRCKVYVGNLGSNAARGEIEEAFSKYGTLRNVWVARNPPGFAFVEFEDPRDAEDAVRALDGV